MASPTIKREKNQKGGRSFPLRLRLVPLVARRCAAVVLEVSMVAASASVPYSIGLYAKNHSTAEPVPINPVLASTQEAIAKTIAYPLREQHTREVAPLTNLFWCGALVLPIVVTGWQLYRLGKTGQTMPKRWFGVQVVSASGAPPGLVRAVWREAVGRWGLPVGTAYLLWRYTGAFPDIGILLGLAGLLLLVESARGIFSSRRRTLHDKLAGTYVLDAARNFPPTAEYFQTMRTPRRDQSVTLEVESGWEVPDQGMSNGQGRRTITTIVLSSQQPKRQPLGLWFWMRRYPGLTLLIMAVAGMVAILGTFVGTQIYIQSQANRREFKQQNNQVFLALVKQLSSFGATAVEERQGAILALARLDDARATPFLVDLLGQEKTPSLIDTIQQALVSRGAEALPDLQRLNQALQNDQETLRQRGTRTERQLVALRQRATNRAIAKILTIYTSQIHTADLSRTNLAQVGTGSTQFTLVLDNLDLSGVNWRSANLAGASLQSSQFYGRGEDGRLGTYDDWIADLSGANLTNADLSRANLYNVLMNRTNLIRAALNQANLSDSHLAGANLSSAQLVGANLHQAVLENASLTGAELGEAKFTLSNLHAARLGQVNATGSEFSFADLTQSNWQGADLSGANLTSANLQDADLSSSKLTGANFRNANLQNAKLRNCDLSAADLRGANLGEADLKGAKFAAKPVQANQIIQTPSAAALAARIKGVDFATVKNLDTKQIKYICSYGGYHPKCSQR